VSMPSFFVLKLMSLAKRPIVIGLLLSILILFVGFSLWLERPSTICETNVARIKIGMSKKEVEEIFGCPPGDYRSISRITFEPLKHRGWPDEWLSDRLRVLVYYDREGNVAQVFPLRAQYRILNEKLSVWINQMLKQL
jgi:hypothetical protein